LIEVMPTHCAGVSTDILTARAARAALLLGSKDTISGGVGNDCIVAGIGHDRGSGGSGNDRMLGKAGTDLVNGDSGTDSAFGGTERDACDAESETACIAEVTGYYFENESVYAPDE
jgi:hypothetical protein